jgi:hypothetical protein
MITTPNAQNGSSNIRGLNWTPRALSMICSTAGPIVHSALLCIILICISGTALRAQSAYLSGFVKDSSDAVVPGAAVTAVATDTGVSHLTTSNDQGLYVLANLQPGKYELHVDKEGFHSLIIENIVLNVGDRVQKDAVLKVGEQKQSVTVSAEEELLQTTSGQLSQVISEQNIVELPLNGRNPAALVLLTPGTANLTAGNARGGTNALQSTTYPGAQVISAGGGRYDGTNYNIDGGNAEDVYSNVSNPFPNPDAVQEFRVVANSYTAEFGRASGAIVNVVTKSGTNQVHGDAFDFLRNEDFNARNFFAPTPDQLKRNQFGGSVGGPIKKDKLFFFGNYQETISRDITEANPAVVPTTAERNGDFSALSSHLVNPYTGAAYPGNQIPASQFVPASVQILKLIPLPTASNGLLYYGVPNNYDERQFMTRADYDISSRQHVYGRYFYTDYNQNPVTVTNNILAAAGGDKFFDQVAAVGDTYTISANMTNSAVFSYTRDNDAVVISSPFNWPTLGVNIATTPSAPEVSFSVAGWFSVGTNHFTDNNRHVFDFNDSLHWVVGAHQIAVGGDFIRLNDNMNNIHRQNGVFTFSTNSLSGNPMSDFMIGDVYNFIQGGGEYFNRTGNLGSLFVEDDYRVRRNLVLNLGLRWDPFVPYSDSEGRVECFLPSQQSQRFPNAPQGYLFAGDPGCPAGGFQSSWGELGPRFGFAYNVAGKGKTTIRGGWGMFYQPPSVLIFDNMADSAPFSSQYSLYKVPFMNPYQGITNPFPAQFGPNKPSSDFAFALPLSLGVAFQPNWTPSKVMNWNFTVEQQLAKDMLLRVAYAASAGRFLPYNTDPNAPLPSPTATVASEQARRPYQQLVQVTEDMSGANSMYNALEVTLEKRFSKNFNVTANYTWSKSMDSVSYSSDLNAITVTDPYNINAYHGVSDFNVPQNFVLNYFWQLPSPGHGWVKAVLGGWSTTGIWTWQSGFPLNITSGGDYSYSLPELANDQAQLVSTPQYTSGPLSNQIAHWFTTSSFTTPQPNHFGDVGRNTLIGPGTFNVDFAAHREFSLSERFKMQYRAEFFNVFNHTELNNPNTTVIQSTFGRITTARDPRIVQMALKLIF